ncbi:MAG: type I restriction-modification system endonuclease, partial [Betaproteobacteria bacterium]|nr:type I restriction-modification system endonuclease [Betaproteobacteria bacterium]
MEVSGNFSFLAAANERLARLGALAERYFFDDAPGALMKLRQMGEFIAKDIAARHGLLPSTGVSFDDTLCALRARSVLPRQVADLFFHLKQLGNTAAHEDAGTHGQALYALKIARLAAAWFHQTYNNAPNFKPGPFIPPAPPVDASATLREEVEKLRAEVQASTDREAKARLEAEKAREAHLNAMAETQAAQEDRAFWEQYATETEAGLKQAETALKAVQAAAQAAPAPQLALFTQLGQQQADKIELDEATTRILIDDQLRAAGWTVDTTLFRHANGTRPAPGQAIAIAEWPTASGPVDYALFVEGRCVGVIEAKRGIADVPGRLGQAKRYARDITLTPDETLPASPWPHDTEAFRVPFTFATNGRQYVKQLETKSGIWFWDARPGGGPPRALVEWFSPRDLTERLEQVRTNPVAEADRELGIQGLRPYQNEAIAAVEAAVARGQTSILLAMATGTGKTRLAIALMYELLRRKQFRRILFLVDRNALGRQTLDAMSTTEASGFLKFDQIFPIADLDRKFPEATDRVQVATVQAMIRRVFDDPTAQRPTPGTYDLIIVDEAHRGYTLDAELREDDLGFRNLEDYLSAYKRVLEYFDATRIALTATPALHTREIFGYPVYLYSYRQAVIDGYLIDHRPPRRITTALSQTGITFNKDEEVSIIDPRTGQVDLFNL